MTPSAEERISEIARPLTAFCGDDAARALVFLRPTDLPQPYRMLLVHESDMTGTLERYSGQEMTLHPIESIVDGEKLVRHVELRGKADGTPAEFGAIEIHLDQFAADPRADILKGETPLGAILRKAGMAFISRPVAYFRIKPGDAIRHSFGVPQDGWLYGRCNQLLALSGRTIADVVEILPPDLPVVQAS